MNLNRPPPKNGEVRARAHSRRPGPCRRDIKSKSRPRLPDKRIGRYIFPQSGGAPLVGNRLVAVRLCLTINQWHWLRWLSSCEERCAA
jgi:hypothetical protein